MSGTAPRILYFHTGSWKSGSTALQVFLEHNQANLREAGVAYEFHPQADHFGGNGRHLAECLFQRHLAPDILGELINDLFAQQATAVCSCDTFAQFTVSEWQQIADVCIQQDVRPRTITYLRDVEPYYRSLHAQRFKTGAIYCDLSEFAQVDHYRLVIDSIKCLMQVFGHDAMTVVHYEASHGNIDAPFLHMLGLKADSFDRSMLAKSWNRSLVQYEIDILRELIEKTGTQYASELASFLLERRPTLQPDRAPDATCGEVLRERHSNDVAWLNKQFFAGEDELKVVSDSESARKYAELSFEVQQAIDRDVAKWCIARLKGAQEAGVAFVAHRLTNIDWRNIGHPSVPSDFDPIAYLLLNEDILRSETSPCEHYINHGRHEVFRRWKW